MPEPFVTHNRTASQFEVSLEGGTAFLTYRIKPGAILFLHAEAPPQLEGRGLAGKLARAGLDFARQEGLQVVPLCPFVAGYVKRHPEYLDLVREDYRARISIAE